LVNSKWRELPIEAMKIAQTDRQIFAEARQFQYDNNEIVATMRRCDDADNPFAHSYFRRFAYFQMWPRLDIETDTDTDIDTDVQTDTGIDLEFIVMEEEELERPYRVIIHNDDVTTFEFVINIVVVVFEQTFFRATRIAFETHTKGNSYICTLPLEEAKSKVFKAQFAARQQGFPLTFSIEPE
jgi:ATP-dependent Clp protease adaptor protein ClpS